MNKKFLAILIAFVLLFASNPAMASNHHTNDKDHYISMQNPVIFEDTFTVTEDGGTYDIGFVTITFPKLFIDADRLPMTFTVQIFADNGVAGIQIEPSTSDFNKFVRIKVSAYRGLLFDKTLGKNIFVNIRNQVILAPHFSWFRFR